MTIIVALDIETTGLDPRNDSIIEIGAIRFNGHRIEKGWTSLVNPRQPIPQMITQLTGITNDMVRNAPTMADITRELVDYVGDAPILGHNVQFDLGFLQQHRLFREVEKIDTYELAAVLLPTASRYNLKALCQELGVILSDAHRALNDAKATAEVYLQLLDIASELPLDMIAEFVRLSEPLDWGAGWAFQQILMQKAHQPIAPRRGNSLYQGLQPDDEGTLFQQGAQARPLTPREQLLPLNPEEVAAILDHGGSFSQYFKNYEHRPEQIEMVMSVTNALSHGQHLMVEAGTGVGKSFAYLVPAALWSIQNELPVVISTNTINLQDQLINKDIPDLSKALNLPLRATVLKGRSNYLCPRRLDSLRQRTPETVDEMRVLAKVMIWLAQNGSGDRSEINLNGPVERETWMRISAENEGCKLEDCVLRSGVVCPFFRAKQGAFTSHIVIVNHALLLADVATGNRVLPEYQYLIIDEAHHLENATTSSLSYKVSQNDLIRLLRELGGTSTGILSRLLTESRKVLRPAEFALFLQSVQRATDLAFRLDHQFSVLFENFDVFLEEKRDGRPVGPYGHQERIIESSRTQPAWENIEVAWEQTEDTLKLLINLIEQMQKAVGDIADQMTEELEDTISSLGGMLRRLTETQAALTSFVFEPVENNIYWVEIAPNQGKLVLQIAPLHIGPLMEKLLWHEKTSVILTSATLTTRGSFDYIRNRLAAVDADELMLGSPFDYENSTMLFVANDIPEPSDGANYTRAIEQSLIRLAKATRGRLLALFTSYTQLKHAAQVITPPLMEDNILVYEQGEGASANTLLETFRSAEKAVLLGTRSFWEGVDIPGQALSVLVITKLPFAVPSDPIVAARSETFEDPFNEYNLPEAILLFRQGFGRLIRTQSDRGVVAILDRRLLTKRYGKAFLDSLPTCNVQVKSIHELPKMASQWLG